jgi:hypothetical protein
MGKSDATEGGQDALRERAVRLDHGRRFARRLGSELQLDLVLFVIIPL